jgi:hypothetical protein
MLVAIGGRQPRTFLGNQKTGVIAFANDIKSHHLRELIGDAVGPILLEARQGAAFIERPQPGIQEIALFHRPGNRGAGAFEFMTVS